MKFWLLETIRLIPGEGLAVETRLRFFVLRINATIAGREFRKRNPHSLFEIRPIKIRATEKDVIALLNEIIRLLEREN